MDLTDAFRFANLGVGALMLIGGIMTFWTNFPLVAIFIILFAGATAALEFMIPPQLVRYCSFYFSFIGRGIFYIFIASIMMHDKIGTICGMGTGIVGLVYAALEFVPSIEAPANMREADGGWGAEGV